jgi:hypothetical protein
MREKEEGEVARAYLLEVHHSISPRPASSFKSAFTLVHSPSTLPISLLQFIYKLIVPLEHLARESVLASTGGVSNLPTTQLPSE